MQTYRGAPSGGIALYPGSTGDIKAATIAANAVGFYLSVASDDVYMTFNGATPNASTGHIIYAGNPPQFWPINSQGANLQFAPINSAARIYTTFLL